MEKLGFQVTFEPMIGLPYRTSIMGEKKETLATLVQPVERTQGKNTEISWLSLLFFNLTEYAAFPAGTGTEISSFSTKLVQKTRHDAPPI
jgi:hypothetical protein